MKYLLAPITIYLWYLSTYYGLLLLAYLMIRCVLLSWFWIIIGLFPLYYITLLISSVIPGIFRYFILNFYGFTWIYSIVHSLAGLSGIILFYFNIPSFVSSEGDELFFLTVLWKISPLKTIVLSFLFSIIVLSLTYSTIIFPFHIKIFDKNNLNS